MLKYQNNTLQYTGTIDSSDSILLLSTDIDCIYIGICTLDDGTIKSISFVKENTLYKGRLLITEEDINNLSNCTIHLVLLDGNTKKETNKVPLSLDLLKIKKGIRVSKSQDIKDVKISIAQLTKKLDAVINMTPSFIVTSTTPINTNYVKPGMIPIAIDETGRCIFQHPFIDHVTEINGQKTVNNVILLTAKDIPIEQTDVESAIKAHTDAIKELNNLMKTISSELKSTKNKVADIEKALLQHTDSSII